MTKLFKKKKKKTIWGPFWAPFTQNWAKINFPEKKDSVIFSIIALSTIVPKSQKPNEPFLRKLWTDTPKTSLFH